MKNNLQTNMLNHDIYKRFNIHMGFKSFSFFNFFSKSRHINPNLLLSHQLVRKVDSIDILEKCSSSRDIPLQGFWAHYKWKGEKIGLLHTYLTKLSVHGRHKVELLFEKWPVIHSGQKSKRQ